MSEDARVRGGDAGANAGDSARDGAEASAGGSAHDGAGANAWGFGLDGVEANMGDPACDGAGWRFDKDARVPKPPARISLVYESADGRLCLFEDAEGHLTAVKSSKLA